MVHILLVEDEVNIAFFIQRGLNERVTRRPWLMMAAMVGHWLKAVSLICWSSTSFCRRWTDWSLCAGYRQTSRLSYASHYPYGIGNDGRCRERSRSRCWWLHRQSLSVFRNWAPASWLCCADRLRWMLPNNLECSDLPWNRRTHGITRCGWHDLTIKEFRLLEYFLMHQGEAINRLALLKNVRDKNFDTKHEHRGCICQLFAEAKWIQLRDETDPHSCGRWIYDGETIPTLPWRSVQSSSCSTRRRHSASRCLSSSCFMFPHPTISIARSNANLCDKAILFCTEKPGERCCGYSYPSVSSNRSIRRCAGSQGDYS